MTDAAPEGASVPGKGKECGDEDMLRVPLPPPWILATGAFGEHYFHNEVTGEDRNEHPLAQIYANMASSDESKEVIQHHKAAHLSINAILRQ